MAWTPRQLPDLTDRVAVVTGANSGIGFHAARALAEHGARVVLACRNPDAGQVAARRIAGDLNGAGSVEARPLDLASISSVRAFAAGWEGPLDLLVNNGGVMAPPRLAETEDGFELQFGTNHLGHFVLTGLLLPALLRAQAGARIVTVSSIAHRGGTERVLDGNLGETYHPQRTYSNSKLANLLFALHLHRELTARELPVTSVAAHPGISATGLVSSRQGMGARRLTRTVGPVLLKIATQSSSTGARPTLFAATAAQPGSYSGPQLLNETRGPVGAARVSTLAADPSLARRLWRVSEDLTHLRYSWPDAP